MEQHPVPQNVTTFQFRLIGDMTIKQFGYLALGVILAYICYKLPLPFFFTWPLTIISALAGFGLAFVPVEERPMDIWIRSFIKNIYNPTQYVWQKRAQEITPKEPAKIAVSTAPILPKTAVSAVVPAQPPPVPIKLPIPTPSGPPITGGIQQVPKQDSQLDETQKKLQEALTQKEQLEKELLKLREKQAATPVLPTTAPYFVPKTPPVGIPPPTPTLPSVPSQPRPRAPQPPHGVRPNVRFLTEDNSIKAGLPKLTTFANVVTGIVKDHIGNLLPGILVTIRDKNDVPLRALKTNKLGQFASSMPLPNGTYLVEIEDPREERVFDRAQVALTGTILPTLEVISKSQKQIDRDKLAKEVFSDNTLG